MLPKIIIGVVVLAVFLVVGFFLKGKKPPDYAPQYPPSFGQQGRQQDEHDLGRGISKPFYSKDNLSLPHTWPGEGNFSNEETEILVFNESEDIVEIKSFDLTYSVEDKVYPQKSGTWEKFPSKENWERIEYIIISAQHYKGEQLLIAPNQKGKLHWHINFGSSPIDGNQEVTIKLTLLKNGETISINEQLSRPSGQVFSKEDH